MLRSLPARWRAVTPDRCFRSVQSRREAGTEAGTYVPVHIGQVAVLFWAPPEGRLLWGNENLRGGERQHLDLARSIIRITVWACHRAPVGVGMPRAISSVAICRADMPAAFSSASTGASCRALSIASARWAGASRSEPLVDPLRGRQGRPRHRRTTRNSDELAAVHSMTSSARPSNGSGIVMPSALAVLRFRNISTFVACCTGSSPGFSPLRMRAA
jgi:hypothetical protein